MATDFLGVSGLTDEANLTLGDSAIARTGNGLPTARALAAGMSDPAAAPTLARMNSSAVGGTATTGGNTGGRRYPGEMLE